MMGRGVTGGQERAPRSSAVLGSWPLAMDGVWDEVWDVVWDEVWDGVWDGVWDVPGTLSVFRPVVV